MHFQPDAGDALNTKEVTPEGEPMQSYLTLEETAEQLKVEVAEIMTLIEQGKLRAIRIGNNIRIPEQEVEKLLTTSPAGPNPKTVSASPLAEALLDIRLMLTRSGRAEFRVRGGVATGAEIWPGKAQYPIKFPKSFMDDLLSNFSGKEVAVGGSFDGPLPGSLGEFIQQEIKTKMNPAVYIAALLIAEGYADASRRGYIRFHRRNGSIKH
jgi:excisionase family DNA binding protein